MHPFYSTIVHPILVWQCLWPKSKSCICEASLWPWVFNVNPLTLQTCLPLLVTYIYETLFCSPVKPSTWQDSTQDPGDFGWREFRFPTRSQQNFDCKGFCFPPRIPATLPPRYPVTRQESRQDSRQDPAEILATRNPVSRQESRQDSRRDFGRRESRLPLRIPARFPPGSRRDFGRRESCLPPRIPARFLAGSRRESCQDLGKIPPRSRYHFYKGRLLTLAKRRVDSVDG